MRTAITTVMLVMTLTTLSSPVATALDLKPYAGAAAPLMAAGDNQRLALWRSLTVDAYAAKGSKDPRFDEDMARVLAAAAAHCVGTTLPMARDEALTLARRLAGPDGSSDPLAKWAHFQLCRGGDQRAVLEAASEAVWAFEEDAKAGKAPRYASLLVVYPLNELLDSWGRTPNPEQREKALRQANKLAAAISAVIRNGECDPAPGSLIRVARNLDLNHQDFGEPIVAATEAALAEAKTDPWLGAAMMAALRINHAWAWRGSGYSNTVTAEGWEGFKSNLAEADRQLGEAYRLHPQEPLLGVMGIKVANAGTSQATVKEWLQRSVAAGFDCMEAYASARNFQLPRWGGSYVAMLALGCDCVDTGRFDTPVPWNLIDCLTDVIDDGHSMENLDEMRLALAAPRVGADLETCLAGYAKLDPSAAGSHGILRVAYLWHAGKTAEARSELQKLPADKRDAGLAERYRLDYAIILGAAGTPTGDF